MAVVLVKRIKTKGCSRPCGILDDNEKGKSRSGEDKESFFSVSSSGSLSGVVVRVFLSIVQLIVLSYLFCIEICFMSMCCVYKHSRLCVGTHTQGEKIKST